MEYLVNFGLGFMKFIPFYVIVIAVASVITIIWKDKGTQKKLLSFVAKVAAIGTVIIVAFILMSVPNTYKNKITVVQPQMPVEEYPVAKVQDLTLQPKQTDAERERSFNEMTDYSKN